MGTRKPDQVMDVRRKSGSSVVAIWKKRSGITARSAPRTRNMIPISISRSPNSTINTENGMTGIVFSNRDWTSGLAGESSKTLSIPNQKKTINNPNRESGSDNFRARWIIKRSIDFMKLIVARKKSKGKQKTSRRGWLLPANAGWPEGNRRSWKTDLKSIFLEWY